ncbi:AAA family ATPase [Flavihumibacter sp. UBA7668]|uniref:AAA family ATPase n=1 Tax=Flavihumibacter sp. UBA7668 TaxID=1946542 RepID=UPI0025B83450|nr:AAA family ATPase [Flavihumibacter sp. UBA7668]
MIHKLAISNYKSVKELTITPKRVNIFIGEHNTGKSNILEALTWFSANALQQTTFHELFRFKNVSNFFFDSNGNNSIEINTDEISCRIRYARNNNGALLNFFEGVIYPTGLFNNNVDELFHSRNNQEVCTFQLSFKENTIENVKMTPPTNFRTYQFKRLERFENGYLPFLSPPFGENIPILLQSNSIWKQMVSEFIRSKGFRLVIKPTENEIEIAKDVNEELYSFPYQTISETMQRYIFLLLAVETNENSIMVLDEPEANMFPFFVKEFAERIELNQSNQYFISTHNPYLLGSLLEKTKKEDIAVFVTKMNDFKTTAKPCNEEQIQELISSEGGAFFSLNNIMD